MKSLVLLAAATATTMIVAIPASAAVIDVNFSGRFNQYRSGCATFPLPGSPPCTSSIISSLFSGSLSYSTDQGHAISGGVLSSDALSMVGQSTTINASGAYGQVYLPLPVGTLSYNNILGSQLFYDLATISLTYPPGVTLDPSNPPPFSFATSATISFVSTGSPGGVGPSLSGIVTSLTSFERSAVPEPSTWLMLFVGVAMVGIGLRRTTGSALLLGCRLDVDRPADRAMDRC